MLLPPLAGTVKFRTRMSQDLPVSVFKAERWLESNRSL